MSSIMEGLGGYDSQQTQSTQSQYGSPNMLSQNLSPSWIPESCLDADQESNCLAQKEQRQLVPIDTTSTSIPLLPPPSPTTDSVIRPVLSSKVNESKSGQTRIFRCGLCQEMGHTRPRCPLAGAFKDLLQKQKAKHNNPTATAVRFLALRSEQNQLNQFQWQGTCTTQLGWSNNANLLEFLENATL
eukprot:Ihof_evm11s73 gene=Ihof_evmTU11s73